MSRDTQTANAGERRTVTKSDVQEITSSPSRDQSETAITEDQVERIVSNIKMCGLFLGILIMAATICLEIAILSAIKETCHG